MLPHSIRWRLPLSYAGIALLTCLVLGGVLITTMQRYYGGLEQDYLEENARSSAHRMERLLQFNPTIADYQDEINRLALFSRAEVSLYDAQNQPIVASQDIMFVNQFNVPAPTGERVGIVVIETTDNPIPEADHPAPPPLWLEDSLLGYRFTNAAPVQLPIERSTRQFTIALHNGENDVVGYLRFARGPAVGKEIVRTATWMIAVASVVAIFFAGLAGWAASRNLTQPLLELTYATTAMTDGKLSARVHLHRQDELGRLAVSFNTMADQINHTIQTLKDFTADAAHELHTPITALQTNLELLATEPNPTHQIEYIHHSQRLTERLKTLVDSMLDLTRLESASHKLTLEPLNLTVLAQRTQTLYASRAEQAGIELALAVPPSPVTALADEKQLLRVMENLVGNALKFTPTEGRVLIGVGTDKDSTQLWVEDTGIGIPPSDLPRLFRRFHRGQNTAAYPGNGLGLVIVKTIIERHNGKICVDSSDQGTKFTVELPRYVNEKTTDERANQPDIIDRR